MPLPLAALFAFPPLAAGAMLAVAIPAGDAIDDSVPILLGVPATVSAIATFALGIALRHSAARSAMWSLASAGSGVVWFTLLFLASWVLQKA